MYIHLTHIFIRYKIIYLAVPGSLFSPEDEEGLVGANAAVFLLSLSPPDDEPLLLFPSAISSDPRNGKCDFPLFPPRPLERSMLNSEWRNLLLLRIVIGIAY